YLNPTHPAPHLMAAELLASSGHKAQALVECRLAAAGAPEPRLLVGERVLTRYPAIDDLLAAAPDDVRHLSMLGKWLVSKGRPGDADRVYQQLLELDPANVPALTALARLAITR